MRVRHVTTGALGSLVLRDGVPVTAGGARYLLVQWDGRRMPIAEPWGALAQVEPVSERAAAFVRLVLGIDDRHLADLLPSDPALRDLREAGRVLRERFGPGVSSPASPVVVEVRAADGSDL